jgi:hypothetical protein
MTEAYPPGTILLLEEGHPLYIVGYYAHLLTLQTLDIRVAADEYRAQFIPSHECEQPTPEGFVAWLYATQRCARLNYQTVMIGQNEDLYL